MRSKLHRENERMLPHKNITARVSEHSHSRNLFCMQVGACMTVQTQAVNSFGRVFDSSQVHFCLALCVWKLNYIRWFIPIFFNLDV
jgi:hypothetical protein